MNSEILSWKNDEISVFDEPTTGFSTTRPKTSDLRGIQKIGRQVAEGPECSLTHSLVTTSSE